MRGQGNRGGGGGDGGGGGRDGTSLVGSKSWGMVLFALGDWLGGGCVFEWGWCVGAELNSESGKGGGVNRSLKSGVGVAWVSVVTGGEVLGKFGWFGRV